MTRDTSGRELPEPSAIYDHESSCWRMFGGMFPSDSMPYLATLPTWGMTRNGELFELPTPEPPTGGHASSSLPPTPTTDDAGNITRDSGQFQSLTRASLSLLPTPRAQNGEPRNQNVWARPLDQPQNLENALALLPTPTVNDMGAGKTVEQWDEWTATMRAKHGNGNGHGPSLSIEAMRLLPTPAAQEPGYTGPLVDEEGNPVTHTAQRTYDPNTGRLVQTGLIQALRIGASTPPPSTDGNTSSDDPPPPLPSLDETATPD